MYKAVYESDSGEKYVFGIDGETIFDMDVGNGMSVSLGTSQGFGQVGETVKTKSVSGRPINIQGCIYGNIVSNKNRMRRILSVFSSGKLIFNNKYFTRVYVKEAPTFSTTKNDGRFMLSLFAPFPFFYSNTEKNVSIGAIVPNFRFPINYSLPHNFGKTPEYKYINAINDGDVSVPFSAVFSFNGNVKNPMITNMKNFYFLKINGSFSSGDEITIYRDSENIFHAELVSNEEKRDILSLIDEESNLFELFVGDNLLKAEAEIGSNFMSVSVLFRTAVCSFYED